MQKRMEHRMSQLIMYRRPEKRIQFIRCQLLVFRRFYGACFLPM